MTAYFEDMIASFSSSEFSRDVAFAAKSILTVAEDNEKYSTALYEMNMEEEDGRSDGAYWKRCCEVMGYAGGLLDAYRMLTNRRVVCAHQAIRAEIEWLEDTFQI